jgi:hypothetical protein
LSVEVGQLVAGAFGGAVVSSVLGPLIAQRRERRDVRADVLRALGAVERTRWAPVEREDFRAAIIGLRVAALVAGANREAVETYARLAQYAQRMSEDSWKVVADPEFGGGIPGTLGDLTRSAASLLVDNLWHPYRKRLHVASGLSKLTADQEALRQSDEGIPWDIPMF